MLRKYSNTNPESLAQIRASYAEIRNFLSRGLFLLAHSVRTIPIHA